MNIKILNKQGATLLTAGKYCAEDIAVTIDAKNLIAENIKNGVEILGVTGSYEGESSGEQNIVKIHFDTRKTASSFFSGYTGTNLNGLKYSDTENVTDMTYMFNQCPNLQTIPALDTSNVTDMSCMFESCPNLQTIPQLNTSNVTSMGYMFNGCTNLQTIPQLDTSNVTNMVHMFRNCTSLQTVPELNTSNVTAMTYMFSGCDKLQSIPLLDTSNVTGMSSMFSGCTNLQTIPQLDTSNVTNMGYLFSNCYGLQTIPQLDTSNATGMSYMFSSCSNLQTIDITSMDKVASTNSSKNMCNGCWSLTKFIIRTMTVIPTLSTNSFSGCYRFTGTFYPTYNPDELKDGRIYVPDNMVDSLKQATNWSTYADIIVPLSTLEE